MVRRGGGQLAMRGRPVRADRVARPVETDILVRESIDHRLDGVHRVLVGTGVLQTRNDLVEVRQNPILVVGESIRDRLDVHGLRLVGWRSFGRSCRMILPVCPASRGSILARGGLVRERCVGSCRCDDGSQDEEPKRELYGANPLDEMLHIAAFLLTRRW
jgi:hypothetical protein